MHFLLNYIPEWDLELTVPLPTDPTECQDALKKYHPERTLWIIGIKPGLCCSAEANLIMWSFQFPQLFVKRHPWRAIHPKCFKSEWIGKCLFFSSFCYFQTWKFSVAFKHWHHYFIRSCTARIALCTAMLKQKYLAHTSLRLNKAVVVNLGWWHRSQTQVLERDWKAVWHGRPFVPWLCHSTSK